MPARWASARILASSSLSCIGPKRLKSGSIQIGAMSIARNMKGIGLTLPTTLIGWSAFQMQSNSVRIDLSHTQGDAAGPLCGGLQGGDWVGVRFPSLTVIPYMPMGLNSSFLPMVTDWGVVNGGLCGRLPPNGPFSAPYEAGKVALPRSMPRLRRDTAISALPTKAWTFTFLARHIYRRRPFAIRRRKGAKHHVPRGPAVGDQDLREHLIYRKEPYDHAGAGARLGGADLHDLHVRLRRQNISHQMQYSFMDGSLPGKAEGLRYAAKKGLGIVVMEPVRGGLLCAGISRGSRRSGRRQKPAMIPLNGHSAGSGTTRR